MEFIDIARAPGLVYFTVRYANGRTEPGWCTTEATKPDGPPKREEAKGSRKVQRTGPRPKLRRENTFSDGVQAALL